MDAPSIRVHVLVPGSAQVSFTVDLPAVPRDGDVITMRATGRRPERWQVRGPARFTSPEDGSEATVEVVAVRVVDR